MGLEIGKHMVHCKYCGAGYVFVSKLRESISNYCGECGEDWQDKRDVPMEQWNDRGQQMNQKKAANSKHRR